MPGYLLSRNHIEMMEAVDVRAASECDARRYPRVRTGKASTANVVDVASDTEVVVLCDSDDDADVDIVEPVHASAPASSSAQVKVKPERKPVEVIDCTLSDDDNDDWAVVDEYDIDRDFEEASEDEDDGDWEGGSGAVDDEEE